MKITLPLKITTPNLNARGYWVRESRRRREREVTAWGLRGMDRPELPAVVMLTRVGPRPLDSDNLAFAFKSVRDAIAAWVGVDDGPGSGLTWVYDQRRGRPREYYAEVEIEQLH